MRIYRLMAQTTIMVFLCSVFWSGVAFAWPVTLVSKSSEGIQSEAYSSTSAVSGDGRYVAFESGSKNLVPLPPDQVELLKGGLYLHDLQTQTTELLCINIDGKPANAGCTLPSISADGRYVVFESTASDLVADDTNGVKDIFLRDRQNGTTQRISVSSEGLQATAQSNFPKISADGQTVVFLSYDNMLTADDQHPYGDIFVRDLAAGTLSLVSAITDGTISNGNNFWYPSISADGTVVAYEMVTSTLPGHTTPYKDVVIHDRKTGGYEVIQAPGGIAGNGESRYPTVSGDGQLIAFYSEATNLIANDLNGPIGDAFVYDRATRAVELISKDSAGQQATQASWFPNISADGRVVVFSSHDGTLVESSYYAAPAYAYDRVTGAVSLVSDYVTHPGNGLSVNASGTVVSFNSPNATLVPNDLNGLMDVFVAINPFPSLEISATPAVITPVRSGLEFVDIVINAPEGSNVQVNIDDEYGTYSSTSYTANFTVGLEATLAKKDDVRVYTITATAEGPYGYYNTGTTEILVKKAEKTTGKRMK